MLEKKGGSMAENYINRRKAASRLGRKRKKRVETEYLTVLITLEINSTLQLIQRTSRFGIFSDIRKSIQMIKQKKKQKVLTKKIQPKQSDIKENYKGSTDKTSKKEHQQKITKTSPGSGNNLHLPHLLSSLDIYQGRIAL